MTKCRFLEHALILFSIALANIRFPATPLESITLAQEAIEEASEKRSADHLLSGMLRSRLSSDRQACAAAGSRVPRIRLVGHRTGSREGKDHGRSRNRALVEGALVATAMVIDADGSIAGFQDKVQIDPSEEATYTPGSGRRVFQAGPFTFGIAICHEGWRYPETVRWAARRGAHVVFHPQFHEAEPGSYHPTSFADPANSFHEKAALCRAAENTCYFATVNYASPGSPTTSAIIRPDGTLLCYQPYG